MSSLVISLLIKEVVAARDVIRELNRSNKINPKLEKAVQNYDKACDEIRKITAERITGPMSAYDQERKAIRRYE